eukprot:Hpha_TRINITY_DN16987_c1_g5::TRINITY_DN16987_c1_g5_i1::g.56357::m.56357/K07750/E1.14.13.72, SC4MOL, ERG25; methylsterol monooxygenase
MSYAASAWQYVVLIVACLLNHLSEPWPQSPFGKAVRESQFIIGAGVAAFFVWVGITLSSRNAAKSDPHTQLMQKAAGEAPPGSVISMQWYEAVGRGVKRLELGLGLVVLAGVGVLLWGAYPLSLWNAMGQWIEDGFHDLQGRYTEKQLFCGGLTVAHLVAHWGCGLLFLPLDLIRPRALLPYKIQPEYELSYADLGKAVGVALMNQCILLASTFLIWEVFPFLSSDAFDPKIPGVLSQVVSILAFLPFTDFFFYWPHWTFHKVQWLYDHVHYLHHSWGAPISITCIYAHPVEFIFGNVTIIAFGPYVFGSHITTWWVWTFIGTVATSVSHSGWRLPVPLLSAGMNHDFHHSQVSGPEGAQNLSNSGIIDAFMHTNDYYNTRTWNVLCNNYSSLDFPMVRILAQRGQLPEQNGLPPGGEEDAEALVRPAE